MRGQRYFSALLVCFILTTIGPVAAQQLQADYPCFEKPLWQRPTIRALNEIAGIRDGGKNAEKWLDNAMKQVGDRPIIPGGVPALIVPRCFYRGHARFHSTLAKADNVDGLFLKAGELDWQSMSFEKSLAAALENRRFQNHLFIWLEKHRQTKTLSHILENSMAGTFTSDGQRIYSLDEMALVPTKDYWAGPKNKTLDNRYLANNVLHAHDLETGKMLWRRGNEFWSKRIDREFDKSHFLGPPLPLQGQLLCVNETNAGNARLVSLDAKQGQKNWELILGKHKDVYYTSPLRRQHAVHLIAKGDMVFCPTHAGILYAVDLKQRKVPWTFTDHKAASPQAALSPWKHPRLFLAKDKIILTSPTSPFVWCLKASDGSVQWKAKWQDAVYLAGVFGDKVLLVGKSSCRALSLAKGAAQWTTATGVPSGLGAMYKGTYYVPLRRGEKSNRPEVCALDVAKGRVLRRHAMKAGDVPGNLVFAGKLVVSQTATKISAYAAAP